MKAVLNITNGDSAVSIMKAANIPGDFLPWRDVLHDGPVPAGLSLEKLSQLRSEFISERGWGKVNEIQHSFIERDNVLKSFQQYDKIILWFEHDLYDQLQILQIVDWFYLNTTENSNLSIICTEQYLGMLSAKQMKSLFKFEQSITTAHLLLAHQAWTAFCSDTPEQWFSLLTLNTSVLPFLHGAVQRQLEEYPSHANGLSRTAFTALKIISEGEKTPGKIFHLYQQTEQIKFLGDSSFWIILNELLAGENPLILSSLGGKIIQPLTPKQKLSVTTIGKEVLSNQRNWLDLTQLDRWIGGVHLNHKNTWYWDADKEMIIKRSNKNE